MGAAHYSHFGTLRRVHRRQRRICFAVRLEADALRRLRVHGRGGRGLVRRCRCWRGRRGVRVHGRGGRRGGHWRVRVHGRGLLGGRGRLGRRGRLRGASARPCPWRRARGAGRGAAPGASCGGAPRCSPPPRRAPRCSASAAGGALVAGAGGRAAAAPASFCIVLLFFGLVLTRVSAPQFVFSDAIARAAI